MTRSLPSLTLILLLLCAVAGSRSGAAADAPPAGGEPDYAEWNRLLAGYYDPARGMDYGGLKAKEGAALQRLRQMLAKVDVAKLDRNQQLAYWLNLYNVNVVSRVVEGYPVASIRDLSTDPLIRLNVFSKETAPFGNGKISLNTIENDRVREGFHDPRIHFAINCAAKSCPPLRTEAFVGARVGQQLDDQVRRYMAGNGIRVEGKGDVTLHVVKIFDWFEKDFAKWGGGVLAFVRKFLPPEKARLLPADDDKVDLDYDSYDWSLNDWKR